MRGLLSEQLEQSLGLVGCCATCGSGGDSGSCSRLFGCGQDDETALAGSGDGSGEDENDECGMSMLLSMSLANAAPLNPAQDSFAVL